MLYLEGSRSLANRLHSGTPLVEHEKFTMIDRMERSTSLLIHTMLLRCLFLRWLASIESKSGSLDQKLLTDFPPSSLTVDPDRKSPVRGMLEIEHHVTIILTQQSDDIVFEFCDYRFLGTEDSVFVVHELFVGPVRRKGVDAEIQRAFLSAEWVIVADDLNRPDESQLHSLVQYERDASPYLDLSLGAPEVDPPGSPGIMFAIALFAVFCGLELRVIFFPGGNIVIRSGCITTFFHPLDDVLPAAQSPVVAGDDLMFHGLERDEGSRRVKRASWIIAWATILEICNVNPCLSPGSIAC